MGTDCEGMCSSCECLPKGNLKQDDSNEHTDKMTNSMEVSQPDSPHTLLSLSNGSMNKVAMGLGSEFMHYLKKINYHLLRSTWKKPLLNVQSATSSNQC